MEFFKVLLLIEFSSIILVPSAYFKENDQFLKLYAAIIVTILAFLIYILVAIVIGMILGTTLIVLPF